MRRVCLVLMAIALSYVLSIVPTGADATSGPEVIVSAAAQAPVTPRPGDVPLIQDEPVTPGLPLHFRTMTDPFPTDAARPLPSREGMDELHASGSAQFSAEQLRAVVEQVGRPLVVVDLRQESHGFLDGVPVSWYALHDQANLVRSLVEVEQDERRRLGAASAAGSATALVITKKSDAGTIAEAEPVTLTARTAQTERELAESLGIGYFRIAATDFLPPTPDNVDRFIAFAAGLPPETWLHVHCHGGDGRTTTFLAIWDMMHNAGTVSVEDIVRRQALIGPEDLFKEVTPETRTYPFDVERAAFIRRFYEYARENRASGFVVPWSAWSAAHPDVSAALPASD